MAESVSNTVITGGRMTGPESPEPVTWTSFPPGVLWGSAPEVAGGAGCPRCGAGRGESGSGPCWPSGASLSRESSAIELPGSRVRLLIGAGRRVHWLRIYFCAWGQRELAGDDDSFTGLQSIFDDGEVAVLSL